MNPKIPFDALEQDIKKEIPRSDSLWNSIAGQAVIYDLKKGRILLQAGSQSDKGYFVLKGCLMHLYLDEKGNQSVLGFAEDEYYPYLSSLSFFTGQDESFEITALEDSLVLGFPRKHLEDLSSHSTEFNRYFQQIMYKAIEKHYRFESLRFSLSGLDFMKALK